MRQTGPATSPQSSRSASASPPSRAGSAIISWLTRPAAISSASTAGPESERGAAASDGTGLGDAGIHGDKTSRGREAAIGLKVR